ncbi:MAG: PDZ domain-containing protein [Actinomycetota bacterium]
MGIDDDDQDIGGGPPPDPSMRQWRHPSEIAAAARVSQQTPRRRSPFVSALAVGAAATIVVGVGAAVAVSVIAGDDDLLSTDGAGVNIGIGDTAPLRDAVGRSTVETATLQAPATLLSTTVPTSTALTTLVSTTTAPFTPAPYSSSMMIDGVFALADGADPIEPFAPVSDLALQRLGGYVVAEGLIFTSASILHDRRALVLSMDGMAVPVEVLGTDPLSDVAVLQPTADVALDLDDQDLWSAPLPAIAVPPTAAFDPAAPLPLDCPPGALEPGDGITVAGAADTEPTQGVLIGPKDRVRTQAGFPTYGAWLTSARRPAGGSGSGILDDEGRLVGLVVDSDAYLATVIPIEKALQIGATIRQWGVPSLQWLGIEGQGRGAAGGVVLDAVDEGGPAADADLRPGDVVLRIEDNEVADMEHLVHLVRSQGIDSSVVISYERDGARSLTIVRVGIRPTLLPPLDEPADP